MMIERGARNELTGKGLLVRGRREFFQGR